MKFNIFAGARRIALVIGLIATAITISALAIYKPYVSRRYKITHPTGPFIRSEDLCPPESTTHYFATKTSSGKSVSIDLCLIPMAFGEKGELLIPFKVDGNGHVWGAASYSSEVSSYERELERRFKLSAVDDQDICKEISREYRENWFSGVGYLAIGLILYSFFVWTMGWIVRGFLGIPRGQDSRPT